MQAHCRDIIHLGDEEALLRTMRNRLSKQYTLDISNYKLELLRIMFNSYKCLLKKYSTRGTPKERSLSSGAHSRTTTWLSGPHVDLSW